MAQRIYLVAQGETKRLIRASTAAAARNHVAKDTIIVEVANPNDTYDLALQGVKVEETSNDPVQTEVGEST